MEHQNSQTERNRHWQGLHRRLPSNGVTSEWPTEDACRARLAEVRWPDGIQCPRCSSANIGSLEKRQTFNCKTCRYQFTVQSGSLFHHSRVALLLWFSAAETIIQYRAAGWYSEFPSAHGLKDELGISYVAAYELKRKIIAELQLPHGGVIGECILMRDVSDDGLHELDLEELQEILNGMRRTRRADFKS